MNYNRKEYIKEKVNLLRNFIAGGQYKEIDNFFLMQKKSDLKDIESEIINAAYIFSFQSMSINRQVLHNEITKRHCALLKNISLDTQLKLFFEMKDDFCLDHVNCLKINGKQNTINQLKDNPSFQYLLTNLFSVEKYQEIEAIKNKTKIDWLNTNFNTLTINYVNGSVSGAFTLNLGQKINKPLNNIVFQFTQSKMQYLIDNGYQLPTEKEVNYLKKEISESIVNSSVYSHVTVKELDELVKNETNEYLIITNYFALQSMRNNNENKNKVVKRKI